MTKSIPLEERVRTKLENINGGYNVEDYCIGRYFLSALVHPQSKDFSLDEKKFIGTLIKQRAYSDFSTCASTASLLTSHLFKFGLPNIRDSRAGYEQFSSEVDLMTFYAQHYDDLNISFDSLSPKAKEYITKHKNPTNRVKKKNHRDIEVYFLTREALLKNNPQLEEDDLGAFEGFKIRPKIDAGEKFLRRASRIINPTKKDLEDVLHPSELLKDQDRASEYLKNQYVKYVTAILNSGEDFHEFRQDDSTNYKLIDPRYVDVPKFLDKIGGLFLIDTGGATIYVDESSLPQVHSSMQYLNRMNIINLINHRYEDNSHLKDLDDPFSYSKDGAVVYGIQGMLGSTFCEIRFNTPNRGLEATIGCKEHKSFKKMAQRDFSKRVENSSELGSKVQEIASMMN